MQDYKARTALTEVNHDRATGAIRTELRRMVLTRGLSELPDWSTLRVIGPFEVFDDEGNIRYEYRGAVRCLPKAEALAPTRVALFPLPPPLVDFLRSVYPSAGGVSAGGVDAVRSRPQG